jgi:HPt (histidine-containing phosphotransfer) domain-containing protein
MSAWLVTSIFVIILSIVLYIEYKKKKEIRLKDQRDTGETTPPSTPSPEKEIKPTEKKPDEDTLEEKFIPEVKETKPVELSEVEEVKPVELPEAEETKPVELPEANYPRFDHSRLIDMGLSEEDAKEFVRELILQIKTQLPLIKEAMDISDFQRMEELTHSIKGSATNLGTGGISDLISDYDTYLKTGTELAIVEAYFEHLNHYYEELKEQYS